MIWHSSTIDLGSKIPTQMVEGLTGNEDSLAPFQGANAIPCPLGMDIEAHSKKCFKKPKNEAISSENPPLVASPYLEISNPKML